MAPHFNTEYTRGGEIRLEVNSGGKTYIAEKLTYKAAVEAKIAVEKDLRGIPTGDTAKLYDISGEQPKRIRVGLF